ncbi:MAG: hypothetical protein M0R34_06095 [Candidatus Marinimicrobia bacterium]|nr:hypothetical protein [Candidatus Neomarinimicrobiota bacterium]MCK9483917.1 hypothetical protein [Candidatus Neomarinimicrobiota bacterium]MCK9558857.1 hypothetical protein [Candidatus Neomarinimicrobiota bacterium]MDD5060844.1 hypothetical protein [Candidatus Neomarinimicrobiota bacterium]MDD5230596.1 hypothetical protein [Candidatus Neomarinimicrobiota bacterium]
MNSRIRKITYSAIFIALIVGVGIALAFIPNVELVTALVFLAGALMGWKSGLIIGGLGELIFSSLNPLGSGLIFPPMLFAQVLAMTLVGGIGGLCRSFILSWQPRIANFIVIGLLGGMLTLFYDICVSLAFPLSAGFNWQGVLTTLVAGLAFSVIHIILNLAIFLFFVPVTAQQVIRAIPYFREEIR